MSSQEPLSYAVYASIHKHQVMACLPNGATSQNGGTEVERERQDHEEDADVVEHLVNAIQMNAIKLMNDSRKDS